MKVEGRRAWLKLAIPLLLFFLAVYVLVALETLQKSGEGAVRRTTYSAAPGGYKALYLWLKALDIPVRRWEKPAGDLPPESKVLLIAGPELGPGTGELNSLTCWVRKGGTLVLAVEPPNVFLDHFGLEAATIRDNHRGEDGAEEIMFQPGPYTLGVLSIQGKTHRGITSHRPETVFHSRDPKGGLIAVVAEGKGRVIALADPSVFSNQLLKKADHPILALNLLLTHRGGKDLLVDEYHHGYGRATSVLGHLGRSRALAPILQALLLLLILWAGVGRRFGPPRPVPAKEHRSSIEYVNAMAQLLRKAKARRLALKSIAALVEDEAGKGLVDKDPCFRETLEQTRQDLQTGPLTDRRLLVCVQGLYQALEEAHGRAPGGRRETSWQRK